MPRDVIAPVPARTSEKRTPFQGAVKDCIAELFKENGGHKCVIDHFGFSLQRAYRITSRQHDDTLSFWRIAALTSAKATAAARFLASLAGGVFVPLAKVESRDAMRLLGESARSHGHAIAEAVTALADGVVTPRERRELEQRIDAAITDLAALRGAIATPEASAK